MLKKTNNSERPSFTERVGERIKWFVFDYSTDGSVVKVLGDIAVAISVGLRSIKESFKTWNARNGGE